MTPRPDTYRMTAELGWRWGLDQVRWDDGPWVPRSVPLPPVAEPPWDRDGLHSGIGGLAHTLAEIRLVRPWTDEEQRLAAAIAGRLRGVVPDQEDCTFFDGLAGTVGVLTALGAEGAEQAAAPLRSPASPDGRPRAAGGAPPLPAR